MPASADGAGPSGARRRRSDVLGTDLAGVRVLYDPVGRTSHVLNTTASATWDLLDRDRRPSELADLLASRFSADRDQVGRDVDAVLRSFEEQALLDGRRPDPPREPRVPLPRSGRWADRAKDLLAGVAGTTVLGPFRAGRFRFTVAADDAALARYLGSILTGLASEGEPEHAYVVRSGGASRRHHLWLDGTVLTRSAELARVPPFLLWHLNRMAVASLDRLVVLHAAGVQRCGRTAVLPADPNAGKTTLTAGLVQRGFDYLSDESIAVDPATGTAEPYAKPLSIERGAQAVLADLAPAPEDAPFSGSTWQVPPDDVRPGSVGGRGPVDLLVFPRFETGSTTTTERLRPVEALLALLDHTFDLSALGPVGLQVLADLARRVPAHALRHGDLESGCRAVAALLDEPDRPAV